MNCLDPLSVSVINQTEGFNAVSKPTIYYQQKTSLFICWPKFNLNTIRLKLVDCLINTTMFLKQCNFCQHFLLLKWPHFQKIFSVFSGRRLGGSVSLDRGLGGGYKGGSSI